MTTDRDLNTLLRAWLGDGPTQAPDRVIDVLVDRIGRQAQRPSWRLADPRRDVAKPVRLLVATAMLVIAVVVGSTLVGGGGGGPGPSPSPSPSSSPTPTPAVPPRVLTEPIASMPAGPYAFTANGGRTTFTVPVGWSAPGVGNLDFSLAPVDAAPDDAVRVNYQMRISSKDAACTESPEPGIGSTASAIANDLAATPGLVTSEPTPVSIGDLDGYVIDLAVAPTFTASCPFSDGVPTVAVLVDEVPGEGPFWGVVGDGRMRLFVLDHPTATNVVLMIDSVDGTTLEDLAATAMPVIETFRFE